MGTIERLIENIEQVIKGKRDVVRLVVTAALANAHVLLEDVPGTGKTMLARALALSVEAVCKRVQFTPDLLPMDITGSMIYNPQTTQFSFKEGPIFTNIFLADEINRATPRTQSSLLEVMEERQVSVDGTVRPIPGVFFVLATQNPIEQHGTYPLPEAQLDRFLFKLSMGYPDAASELAMLDSHEHGAPIHRLKPVVKLAEFAALQDTVAQRIKVVPEVKRYILDIVGSLRRHADLSLGPSPRAALALMRAGMAAALVAGRDHVRPDDIKELAVHVLSHRLALKASAIIKRIQPRDVVLAELDRVPVPTMRGA